MKFFQKYGWVIDYIAMTFMLFIAGIAITIYVVPSNYFIEALTASAVLSLSTPFMVRRYDESGVRKSVIIAMIVSTMHKLSSTPEPKQSDEILIRKT
ncbi:MAG: hypothetical protein Q8M92_09340 [Candidatus Subteraquimicrobiales bacterium]|nr:hypothetical protein [Candidatus Subteraquimicrobiales bacterium]